MSDNTTTDLLYLHAKGDGWGPTDVLARLAARLLDANLICVQDRALTSAERLSSLLPRRRARGRKLVVLAASPGLLGLAARRQHWLPGYDQTAAWVIDSFWTDRMARFAKSGQHFDHFFITDRDLQEQWEQLTHTQTSWLPWGTDTLAVPDATGDRTVDLLRMGRQPEAWQDDVNTIDTGARMGLTVHGRPPMGPTGLANQQIVWQALQQTRFVLAFHNLVSPAAYTHPTRSYITGRWTDALAAGATVVGAAPANAADILWEGATVELPPEDLTNGLAAVRQLTAEWSPDQALFQQHRARTQLDWRHRLVTLNQTMGWTPTAQLTEELTRLRIRPRRERTDHVRSPLLGQRQVSKCSTTTSSVPATI